MCGGGPGKRSRHSPCLGTKSILTSVRERRASGTGRGAKAEPSHRAPTPARCQLTHEMELGRQVAGKALRHKAVVSLVRRCDVINGQFVDPAEKWGLRGPPPRPPTPQQPHHSQGAKGPWPTLGSVVVWYFKCFLSLFLTF